MFALHNNNEFYKEQFFSVVSNDISKTTVEVNHKFTSVNHVMDSLIFSQYANESTILSICEQENGEENLTDAQRLANYRKFNNAVINLIGNSDTISGVYLFTESGYTYQYMKSIEYWVETDYKNDSWYNHLFENGNYRSIDMYDSRNPRVNGQQVIFSRMFTTISGVNTGVMAIVCTENIFQDIKESTSLIQDTCIFDGKNNVLFGDPDKVSDAGQINFEEIQSKDEGISVSDDGSYALAFSKTDINDWKIVSRVSLESYDNLASGNTIFLIISICCSIIFVVFAVLILSKSIIRPLVDLSAVMTRYLHGEFAANIRQEERDDEIGILFVSFHKMVNDIERLINEKYVYEIKYLKSKMNDLMAQINSHFVFNTLENINCLAEIDENQQIATMSKSLGDMLRYSVQYEADEDLLIDESKHIEDYINIQQIRFDNPILLHLDFVEEIGRQKVLRFMLQPIVENAIEHGLADISKPWEITIRAYRDKDELLVEVLDNGVGIEPDILEKIRNRIYSDADTSGKDRHGIGLANIQKRIQLLYAGKFGLHIQNNPTSGVIVTVHLPWQQLQREE